MPRKPALHIFFLRINDCHTSLRVDVKDNAKAGGAATRDTIYWGFTTDTQPVRFKAQSHYYVNPDNTWNEQAIVNDMIEVGKQFGLRYEPRATISNSGYVPSNLGAYRSGSNYNQAGYYTLADYDAFYSQRNFFDAVRDIADHYENVDGDRDG